MSIIDDYEQYLEKKHRGGMSGKKGSGYEDYYATFQIALLLHLFAANMENVKVSGQTPYTFIDDLVITLPKKKIYHQIKNVNGLSWKSGNKTNTLEDDFKCQKIACQELGENFKLKLVYSDENCSAGKSMPDSIVDCTELVYFKSADDINASILTNSEFKDALSNISIDKRYDKLTDLGTCILGIWCGCRQDDLSIRYFYDEIKKKSRAGISLENFSSIPMTPECSAIFDNIDIQKEINGNLLRWQYKSLFNGSISWSKDVDELICRKNPTDFFSFLSIINSYN